MVPLPESSPGTRQSLKTLGKEGLAYSTSIKPSLPSTFSRALGKEKQSLRRRLTETVSLSSVPGDTQQRSYLCRVSAPQHSAKNPPERVPMSGSLPSARYGTWQSVLLCRVSETLHLPKNLYRCPGLGSLSRAMVLTLNKESLCQV